MLTLLVASVMMTLVLYLRYNVPVTCECLQEPNWLLEKLAFADLRFGSQRFGEPVTD
jgi:hypothetical protein